MHDVSALAYFGNEVLIIAILDLQQFNLYSS